MLKFSKNMKLLEVVDLSLITEKFRAYKEDIRI